MSNDPAKGTATKIPYLPTFNQNISQVILVGENNEKICNKTMFTELTTRIGKIGYIFQDLEHFPWLKAEA